MRVISILALILPLAHATGTYGPPYLGGCGYYVNQCNNYDRASGEWQECGLEAATKYCQQMGYGSVATDATTKPQDRGSSCLMSSTTPIEAGLPGPNGGPQMVYSGVTCV